jgi:hypothetical protein
MNDNIDQPGGVCDLGVVLFMKNRLTVGLYGYLVPYEAEANRAVIYFDKASLIDSREPIAEGSLVHYEIQEENLDERIKVVNIEVERFTTHLPQLVFNQSDLRDFPVLKPSDPLGNHLLKGLSRELKRLLERYYAIRRVITDGPLPELAKRGITSTSRASMWIDQGGTGHLLTRPSAFVGCWFPVGPGSPGAPQEKSRRSPGDVCACRSCPTPNGVSVFQETPRPTGAGILKTPGAEAGDSAGP